MLKTSNIILISIIGLLILFLIFTYKSSPTADNGATKAGEKFSGIMAQPIYKYKYRPNKSKNDEILDDVISFDGSVVSTNVIKEALNPNYINIQFHNDYRDVITGINNLVPEKRQRFNLANIPLNYSEPRSEEVKHMVNDFITVLNENLKTSVPEYRNSSSGWDEKIPDPTGGSGWAKVQRSLGLAPSIYNDPAKKCAVKLIAINYVQKYETDDEVKYAINLVIQKLNVQDQMVLKASFVQDKSTLHDENDFFVSKNVEMKVIIEDIFVTGFLSNGGPDTRQQFDMDKEKFYDYDNMEFNNMTDPKYIQAQLMKKYKQRTSEMDNRNGMLDSTGQLMHKELPFVYDFSNIQGTRTILDDFNTKKVFY